MGSIVDFAFNKFRVETSEMGRTEVSDTGMFHIGIIGEQNYPIIG
jgi:hypothetical protein